MTRILFAWTRSEPADTDRAIAISAPGDLSPTILFDDPGVFDSAPARSPDGSRIAFESDSNRLGTNPEGDRETFVMNADGGDVRQLTRNAIHDEGPAWSPDQTMLAYTSGPDNEHGDIQVMTADGVHLRTLASYDGLDESPDWQAIPAPATDRRCGDLTTDTADLVDVRAAGDGLSCAKARARRRLGHARAPEQAAGVRRRDRGLRRHAASTARTPWQPRRHRQRQARRLPARAAMTSN